jgi:molybdopterin synthase sulfur carrier subunit
MIALRYFASLRERLGMEGEALELPAEVTDLSGLLALLRARGGAWAEVLADEGGVLLAINQEMARPGDAIADGDEVGLFPPVTGG